MPKIYILPIHIRPTEKRCRQQIESLIVRMAKHQIQHYLHRAIRHCVKRLDELQKFVGPPCLQETWIDGRRSEQRNVVAPVDDRRFSCVHSDGLWFARDWLDLPKPMKLALLNDRLHRHQLHRIKPKKTLFVGGKRRFMSTLGPPAPQRPGDPLQHRSHRPHAALLGGRSQVDFQHADRRRLP